MRELGIYSTSGGARGVQIRLRNQMRRLFGCTVLADLQGCKRGETVRELSQ